MTGEVGMGKTIMSRMLIESKLRHLLVAYILNPSSRFYAWGTRKKARTIGCGLNPPLRGGGDWCSLAHTLVRCNILRESFFVGTREVC